MNFGEKDIMPWQMEARWSEANDGVCICASVCVCACVCLKNLVIPAASWPHASADLLPGDLELHLRKSMYGVSGCLSCICFFLTM